MFSQKERNSTFEVRILLWVGHFNPSRVFFCTGFWAAKTKDKREWIQADLRTMHRIESVTTRGRGGNVGEWVRAYAISHSKDETTWISIYRLYHGNVDQNTKKTNQLPSGTDARFIRLQPRAWQGHISMRFDVTGCELSSKFTLNTTVIEIVRVCLFTFYARDMTCRCWQKDTCKMQINSAWDTIFKTSTSRQQPVLSILSV